MLEIKPISRDYGFGNFKFTLNNKNFSKKKYHELYNKGEYQKMKDIFIPYYEKKLHVIATYIYMSKYVLPILLLFTLFLFTNPILQMIIPIISLLISFIVFKILNKKWLNNCQIYSLELSAVNYFMSKKYGGNFDNDFDNLGEMYINGELS